MAAVAHPLQLLEDPQFAEPTEQPQPGPRTYGERNVDLREELQNALRDLLHEACREDLYQRRIEVMRDRRNRFYERGIQHIYEDVSGAFVLSSAGQQSPDPNNPGSYVQCGQYNDNYNIFGRSLQIIIAKLTENPPGVVFEPDSGDSSVDEQAATAAEGYRIVFERQNDTKDILTAVVRMMGLSGRTVAWTRTEEGKETTSIYGTLETKCPIMARKLKDCPYFIVTEDPHVYNAKMEYPEFADKIVQGEDGVADTQFERLARIGALQGHSATFQITDSYNYYVEEKHAWFRPAMFLSKRLNTQYADVDETGQPRTGEDGQIWTLRDALKEAFPDGSKVCFVGNQYVGSENEAMDDHLAFDFPYAGEGASRMAIMDPAIPIQDDFNDDMNNYHEVKVVGWPSTWVNEDYSNIAFVNDQIAAPYCFRALKSQISRDPSAKMENSFYREPNPEIPPSFMQHTEYMATQLLQFILAIPSAVQGAGMPDQKTKGGYQEAIAQAMGQLGVIFGAVQRLYSKIIRQAAMAAAQNVQDDQQSIVVPGPKGNTLVKMGDIAKGNFLCHPDEDSGYPESTAQKRMTLQAVLEMAFKDPIIAQAMLSSPETWKSIIRVFGLNGVITIPEAIVRDKQSAEIELLLQQSPQGPSEEELIEGEAQHASEVMMAKTAGGEALAPFDPNSLMKSSIQPGPLDYHEWEFEECREYLSNWGKVQQQIAAGNEAGVMNVQLHAQEHQKLMAAQQMQQMMAAAAMHPKPAEKQPPKGQQQPAA